MKNAGLDPIGVVVIFWYKPLLYKSFSSKDQVFYAV